MKFDTERAMTWARRFESLRAEGMEEGRTAGLVAEEFARIGLRVEDGVVLGSRFPGQVLPALGWIGFGLGMTLAAMLPDRGMWNALRLLAAIGGMIGWGVAAFPPLRFGHGWPPRECSRDVLARRTLEAAPAVRVVFQTPLHGLVPRRRGVAWWASSVVLGVLVGSPLLPGGWAMPILGLLWAVVLVGSWQSLRGSRALTLREDRTGLAVLLELARTWPRRAEERVEAHFAAVGGHGFDGDGARGLARTVRSEWPAKPTLTIGFLAPGVGSGLILASRTHETLARSAASDLWVPHRSVRWRPWTRWAGASGPSDAVVWLIGDAAFARPGRGGKSATDPEAMGRAAQLATEIALRWAKQAATAATGPS